MSLFVHCTFVYWVIPLISQSHQGFHNSVIRGLKPVNIRTDHDTLVMWHDTMTRTQTHASALQNQSWQWKMTHFVYIFESFLMFFKVEFVAELPVISCKKHVFQIPRGSIVLTWFWHYGASQVDCAQRPLGQGTACDDLVRWVQQGGP
jgi:hypothetical protein